MVNFKATLAELGAEYLTAFQGIGPVTACHLARNLGLQLAKSDRHLSRIASVSGYANVNELCDEVSRITGDPIGIVDLVLWRYATLDRDYQSLFEFS